MHGRVLSHSAGPGLLNGLDAPAVTQDGSNGRGIELRRPLLLDLFCGAGGAAMGYYRAGFDVVGVDIKPQPRYPFEFHQADAFTFSLDGYDVIHASPPCQPYSTTRSLHDAAYPDLVARVRERIDGKPYVIENVQGSPLAWLTMLCGSSFGLRVRRHRLFESSMPLMALACQHDGSFVTVTGGGPTVAGYTRPPGGGIHRKPKNMADASDAMGIDWMTRDELNEAIPPAYTQFIGEQLLLVLEKSA